MNKLVKICLLPLMLAACGQVDTGERGLKSRFGEIEDVVLTEGLHFYNPLTTSLVTMNTQTQKMQTEVSAYTKDMQTASFVIGLNFSINGENAHNLYLKAGAPGGRESPYYKSKIILPSLTDVVKNVIGQYEANELIFSREEASEKIKAALTKDLEPFYIDTEVVYLENIAFSEAYERAIEAKQIAEQDALKAKNETSKIQEEADQKLIVAKAEAESMKIRSQALSQNKGLIEYEKVQVQREAAQKWDGKLPVNMYGSAPLPMLNLK